MSTQPTVAGERLRSEGVQRTPRVRVIDAEVYTPPRFLWLVAIALGAILIQSTLLRPLAFRNAHISLLTILLVWTGLRCGPSWGGALGLISGLIEDALGSGGVNVVGTTLVGFTAGLLNVRFFADSLPVFTSAVAAATIVRGIVTYLVLEVGFGERGLFHRMSHELAWQIVLNVVVAAMTLLTMRAIAHSRT